MNFLEIIIVLVVMFVLSPFFAWALSIWNIFFTTCPSGNIKFIVKGETVHAVIYDEAELKENEKLEPGGFKKRWKLPFGLYWIGFPGIFRVHTFLISKEVDNPNGKEPHEWVINKGEVEVDSLRRIIQRSFVFYNIELKDRAVVNVLITVKMRVMNWFIPIFELKGKFFENASSMLEAAVADELKNHDLQKFLEENKGEVGGILEYLKADDGNFAKEFIRQVGLELQGINIGKQDPGDQKLRDAMNANIIAQKEGEATITKAEADSKAKERLAKARGEEIKQAVEAFGNAEAAAKVLRAEQIAKSNITTLVESGGAPPVLPIGGTK